MKKKLFLLISIILYPIVVSALKLTAYIPKENPTGTGVIICPGGSYFWLGTDVEGHQVAQWLNENSIAAFVLEYSHGGWGSYMSHIHLKSRMYPSGYHDLCEALDSVRLRADDYGIDAKRIGCMGFSAGGHLVMNVAEQLPVGKSDIFFVAPIYPVVSMSHDCTHKRSRRGLLGENPSPVMLDSLSIEKNVPKDCPPVFLVNCDDDPIVHPHNAELLDSALTVNHVPHQYEHYRTGGHGFGVSEDRTSPEAIQWKSRFLEWLNRLIKSL